MIPQVIFDTQEVADKYPAHGILKLKEGDNYGKATGSWFRHGYVGTNS